METTYKLLIIDDNEEILIALSDFFSKTSYEVISANNGLDGLKLIEKHKDAIDLIITDLVMPNISGVAVISIVKKKYPRFHTQPTSIGRILPKRPMRRFVAVKGDEIPVMVQPQISGTARAVGVMPRDSAGGSNGPMRDIDRMGLAPN